MGKEIERKFLVNESFSETTASESQYIRQAYISITPESTVRIRICNDSAYLTIKGTTSGTTRSEWEYTIPVTDASQIINECACTGTIEKTRYIVGPWEVDVFHGRLAGLILAEIELESEDTPVTLPPFINREVTGDPRYYNSILAVATECPPIK